MFLVTKIFKFDSAHNLLNYNGACENMHGHTYILETTVKCAKHESGLALDFNILKKIVNENVVDILDHKYLNDIIYQPTAENICEWIWKKIEPHFNSDSIKLFEIKLFEGPNSFITYRGGSEF